MSRYSHVQATLIPPEVVEATLRLGIVGAGNHVQVAVEVRSATDGALLALETLSHADVASWPTLAEQWTARLIALTREYVLPF